MTAKHLQIQAVHLSMDPEHPGSGPVPHRIDPENIPKAKGQLHAMRIPEGMGSGKSAVFLQFDLDDGTTLLVECSLALLSSISVAFHARDDAEGRASSR